jgi:hypothetical protein
MVMPKPAYDEARLRARYHVQVELGQAGVGKTPAHVPIVGRVARVFRGDGLLRPGEEVHFSVAVCRPGDSLCPGGDLWMHLQDFETARYMEVFLDGTPPACKVARSQCFAIPAPSDTPSVPVPTEAEIAASWAAFRGRGMGDVEGRRE